MFSVADLKISQLSLNDCFVLAIVDRKDRLKSGLSFHVDKKGCVRVDKDGRGLVTVWRQQLQQFKNVSADMANAIVAEYSSPMILYQVCSHFVSLNNHIPYSTSCTFLVNAITYN